MATTTTFKAIRNTIYAELREITPATRADILLERHPGEYLDDLRTWALRVGTTSFRKLEMVAGEEVDAPWCDPTAKEVRVRATLTVAYPRAPGVYGLGNLDQDSGFTVIEDVIEEDAKLISDKIFSAANYVAGQSTTLVTIMPTDRSNEGVYFKEFDLDITFTKAQSLD